MKFLKVEPYGTAKLFYLSSAFWFLVGATEGIICAAHMTAPELLNNVGWLVFGRVRAMHTNTMIVGFVGSALVAAPHYYLPRLLKTPLYSERLGKVSLWVWNLCVVTGTVTLGMGLSQGREYAEWIWPVDVGVLLAFGLIFVNFTLTLARRKENLLYISVWYAVASLIFTWGIYFFGNAVWNPSTGAITGIADGVLAWFYGHGVIGLFLTPLAVAIAYYVVPNVVRSPVYSHVLSLVGFWTILMIYAQIGAHHLLQTPTPTWVKVVAITGSIGMVIPVFTVLINLWLTMRKRLGLLHADIGGRFVMAGLVWYLVTCLQGPLQSLPVVQRITHLNNWVVAHAHLGVLGFSGTIALGGMYYMLPRIVGRRLYNPRLADVQYWLVLFGMAGFWFVLTAGGLVQGNAWLNGETVYRTLPMIHPYFAVRSGLGVLLLGAAAIGLYNVSMTILGRTKQTDDDLPQVGRVTLGEEEG